MADPDDFWKVPDTAKTLAAAYERNMRGAAQVWAACSATAVVAFLAYTAKYPITILVGIQLGLPWAPFVIFLIATLLDVVFCANYMKQAQTARLYRSLVDEITENEPAGRRDERMDMLFCLIPPFLSTVRPIVHGFKKGLLRKTLYVTLKVPSDIILFTVPVGACLLSFLAMPQGSADVPTALSTPMTAISWGLMAVSVIATAIAAFDAARWIWSSARRE